MKSASLSVGNAANGFTQLYAGSLPQFLRLVLVLMLRHGFRPKGGFVAAIDERIFPSLTKSRLSVLTGWDRWFGYYLLADTAATDAFLREKFGMYARSMRSSKELHRRS